MGGIASKGGHNSAKCGAQSNRLAGSDQSYSTVRNWDS